MKVTTVGKGWFHLHVVPHSPATRERRQQCPLEGGLDLATSTLTLLARNLRAKSCKGTNFFGLSLPLRTDGAARHGTQCELKAVFALLLVIAIVIVIIVVLVLVLVLVLVIVMVTVTVSVLVMVIITAIVIGIVILI